MGVGSSRMIGSPGHHQAARLALLAVLATAAAACSGEAGRAEQAIRGLITAVQAQDLDRLYCLLAGAAPVTGEDADPGRRADFDAWALSRYEAYLDGRDRGGVELDDSGIALTKAFALGKGTYHEIGPVRVETDGLRVVSRLRFGYGQINYDRLSPGTTFYVATTPVGAILAVTVPYGSEEREAEVLDTLELEWHLAPADAAGDCPERWTLVRVEPVPGSETTTLVGWRF